MKITTILGSPRRQGSTAAVLHMVERRLTVAGHEVRRFDVARMKLNGCLGCLRCQRSTDGPSCVQRDELSFIVDSMMSSEAVLYATPNYGWGPTAQLKALLDRQISLLTGYGTPQMGCHLAGRRLALLITSMGPREDNSELLERPFEKMAQLMRCKSLGTYLLPGTMDRDVVSRLGPALADRLAGAIVTGNRAPEREHWTGSFRRGAHAPAHEAV